MILPLAKVPFIMSVMGIVWIVAAILLGLIILIQKGRGGGLGAALGGIGAGSLMGTKTGDFLTWITIAFTVVFLLLGILMSRFYRPMNLEQLQPEQAAVQLDQTVETDEQAIDADQASTTENADSVVDEATQVADENATDAQTALPQDQPEAQTDQATETEQN